MRYKKDHPTKQIIAADLLCFPLSRKFPISASLVNIVKCGLVECHNEKVFANFRNRNHEVQSKFELACLLLHYGEKYYVATKKHHILLKSLQIETQ